MEQSAMQQQVGSCARALAVHGEGRRGGRQGYVTADVADEEGLTKNVLSGTKFRKALRAGEDIPDWCLCPPPTNNHLHPHPSLECTFDEHVLSRHVTSKAL